MSPHHTIRIPEIPAAALLRSALILYEIEPSRSAWRLCVLLACRLSIAEARPGEVRKDGPYVLSDVESMDLADDMARVSAELGYSDLMSLWVTAEEAEAAFPEAVAWLKREVARLGRGGGSA